MKLINKRMSWKLYLLLLTIVFLLIWQFWVFFQNNYRIGIDTQLEQSLPGYHVYLTDLNDKELVVGKVYQFRTKGLSPFYSDGEKMVKYLRAIPGDEVSVQSGTITVNNKQVAWGLAQSNRLGVDESHFYGKKILAAGEYWFLGTHMNSFDSRYWGSVNEDQIVGRAYPLF
ncbi:signal peptidase I [Photobacterium ganghwense]|uniref:signal peptidase I n=1 Tax=Photobacterium ganghwense TaxID=320778 RepID=UPI001A8CB34F|nr:signal peptidase I [Photobacterium ganghwense]QSV17601.1 signal peptidase I [Photobacterium ganghwense]